MRTALILSWIVILGLLITVVLDHQRLDQQHKDMEALKGQVNANAAAIEKKVEERFNSVAGWAGGQAGAAMQTAQNAANVGFFVDKRLKGMQRALGPVTPRAEEFIKHRDNYDGLTVKMMVTYADNKDMTLRDWVAYNIKANGGNYVWFQVGGQKIAIRMPLGAEGSSVRKLEDIPPLKYGETAIATFVCEGPNQQIVDIKPE